MYFNITTHIQINIHLIFVNAVLNGDCWISKKKKIQSIGPAFDTTGYHSFPHTNYIQISKFMFYFYFST